MGIVVTSEAEEDIGYPYPKKWERLLQATTIQFGGQSIFEMWAAREHTKREQSQPQLQLPDSLREHGE